MDDHFREMEIMRKAHCVYGPEATYVELPDGGWEEHGHHGGMGGTYPLRGDPFPDRPTPAERTEAALRGEGWITPPLPPRPHRRPWWQRFLGRK